MDTRAPSRGFTLIELMIVIAIIAILAAIAIPAYQDYVIRSQVTEGISLSTGAKAAVWDFYSNTGRFPTNNTSAGMVSSGSITGSYVSDVKVTSGQVTVKFQGPKANVALGATTLVLSPVSHAGSIAWTCTPSTVKRQYLPSACRDK